MTTPHTLDWRNDLLHTPHDAARPQCPVCDGGFTPYQWAHESVDIPRSPFWSDHIAARAHVDCTNVCERCEDAMPDWSGSTVRMSRHSRTTEHWCPSCVEDHTWSCFACGETACEFVRAFDNGDGHYCASCFDDVRDRELRDVIGSYHNGERRAATRPRVSPWTRAHGNRMLGVELELERHGACNDAMHDMAHAMLTAAHGDATGADRLLFAEHDGSLTDGFELITQPMGLDMHADMWRRVLSCDAIRGMRSHDTSTCGLHVHVSRAGLTPLTLAKAVVFLNDPCNEFLMRAVARRYGGNYCKRKTARLGACASSYDRYEMLNLTNSRTVEFRLFRGTTRYETLMACVEFAHATLEWAARASCADLSAESFLRHVYAPEHTPNTKHLRAYLARRVTLNERQRERVAPSRVELLNIITRITGKAPVCPPHTDNNAPWAEV